MSTGAPVLPPLRVRVRAAPPLPTTPFILPLPQSADYSQLVQLVRDGLAAHVDPNEAGVLLPAVHKELVLEQAGFRILPIYRPADSLRDGDVVEVRLAVKKEKLSQSAIQPSDIVRATPLTTISSSSKPVRASRSVSLDESSSSSESESSSSSSSTSTSTGSSSDSTSSQNEGPSRLQNQRSSASTSRTGLDFPLPPPGLAASALGLATLLPGPAAGDMSPSDSERESSAPLMTAVATRKLNKSISPPTRHVPPGKGTAQTARTNALKKRKRASKQEALREEMLQKRLKAGTWDYEDGPGPSISRVREPEPKRLSSDRRPAVDKKVVPRREAAQRDTNPSHGAKTQAAPVTLEGSRSVNSFNLHPGGSATMVQAHMLPPGLGSLGFDDEERGLPALPNASASSVLSTAPPPALDALAAFEQAKRRRLIQDMDGAEEVGGPIEQQGVPAGLDALRDLVSKAIADDSAGRTTGLADKLDNSNHSDASASSEEAVVDKTEATDLKEKRAEVSISNDTFLRHQGFVPPSERPPDAIPEGMLVTSIDCDAWYEEHGDSIEAVPDAEEETITATGRAEAEASAAPVATVSDSTSSTSTTDQDEDSDSDSETGDSDDDPEDDTDDVSDDGSLDETTDHVKGNGNLGQGTVALGPAGNSNSSMESDGQLNGDGGLIVQAVRSRQALAADMLVDLDSSKEASDIEFVSHTTPVKVDIGYPSPDGGPKVLSPSTPVARAGAADEDAVELGLAGAAATLEGSPAVSLAQLAALRAKALQSKASKAMTPSQPSSARTMRMSTGSRMPSSHKGGTTEGGTPSQRSGSRQQKGGGSKAAAAGKAKASLPVDYDSIAEAQTGAMLDYGAGGGDSDSDSE